MQKGGAATFHLSQLQGGVAPGELRHRTPRSASRAVLPTWPLHGQHGLATFAVLRQSTAAASISQPKTEANGAGTGLESPNQRESDPTTHRPVTNSPAPGLLHSQVAPLSPVPHSRTRIGHPAEGRAGFRDWAPTEAALTVLSFTP